ncbi:ribosome biogenesis protein BRX1 homolog, putative [Plasmodium gallinaceum]|uniref:Ribosome biogenesis protein BRX1 homolog, putative n=1 Tax=Plasmodium gallinaceum TaxID=5849 RepID=A0A1J1GLK3_PLAGA|nr:ribosome biogenesis protein BRX1 homolog, putative [Plasmodium gallinaceum]CRG93249.1 ribosome biogenesis protein BRX1 homolog, putative [Plasmodium gallinaceum]
MYNNKEKKRKEEFYEREKDTDNKRKKKMINNKILKSTLSNKKSINKKIEKNKTKKNLLKAGGLIDKKINFNEETNKKNKKKNIKKNRIVKNGSNNKKKHIGISGNIKNGKKVVAKKKINMNENNTNNINEKEQVKKGVNEQIDDEKDRYLLKIDEDPYLLKDAKYIKKSELWKNKQRVLIVRSPLKKKNCKSFIENLKLLLPHHKIENKWDKKLNKSELSEISYSRNCNNIIFFDVKKKRYCLWICKNLTGPSLYFEILDYIPLHSLIFSGNCLLYSRPLLIFSKHFDELDHLKIIKEMFIHVFGTPNYHPLSKPFYDHCYNFFYINNLIYFRHYQILPITLADSNNINKQKLVEIGPKFTLHIIKIFEECFKGRILYENVKYKNYVTPQQMKLDQNLKKKMINIKKKEKKIKKIKSINRLIKTDIDF